MTDNENLELKKRSRRRLVGAAALALLAAIILPMVMDQEPGSPAQDIQVSIPDREADAALARPTAGPSTAAGPQVAPPSDEPPPGADADVSDPIQTSPAAPAAPAPGRTPARVEPAAKPAPPSNDDAARAAALLEDRKPAAAPASGSFVVQIGAFGEPAKATAIGSDLKGRGFAAYTEKAGAVTRVRVGPFRSREEADRTAERLRLAGVSGVVVPR